MCRFSILKQANGYVHRKLPTECSSCVSDSHHYVYKDK
ncbi:hypothetical protein CHCC15290_0588 [Bacillus licheniformis]|nr:hypothetical protein CHCC15290_0588 [Bacillus licheniformis]